MATVRIPASLRNFTKNQEQVEVSGATVAEVLANLDKACPGIGARVLDEKGGVRRYVNVFHNDEDIRFLKELATPVKDSDKISLVPAIAGGSARSC
jgi:molybdopterin converting factor small subunit